MAICFWLCLVSPGWGFSTEGVINADFTYRNLLLREGPTGNTLSGLLKNRSDRAYLGVLIFFKAVDCVTGRAKWQAPLYIANIDPQVEMPFRMQLPATASGFVCKFNFRTGYHLLPAETAAVPPERVTPAPAQPRRAAAKDPVVYAWIDGDGIIHYSSKPVESRGWERLDTGNNSGTAPIYTWIDRNGVTRYSDTPPEPQVLIERYQYTMQTADTIDTYAKAMRQRIWANWSHPLKTPAQGTAFKAVVRFFVLPDGRIRKIRIESSSGIDALDESFYNAVAKSDPLPRLPAQFAGNGFDARIGFAVKGQN